MSRLVVVGVTLVAAVVLQPAVALAHCDAMDGPVVSAARAALETKDVGLVLRWVPPASEADVRGAFERTLEVRGLGGSARELADTWFFETLVRIHRAGEGEPFEGLKPAGHIEPFVSAVDQSLASGNADPVVASVTTQVNDGIRERFARARAARATADSSVEAGRAFVASYVEYLHHVEALLKASAHGGAAHAETAPAVTHVRH